MTMGVSFKTIPGVLPSCSGGVPVVLAFDILRFSFAVGFISLHGALMGGLFLELRRDRRVSSSEMVPLVSIIIPIHNEAQRLEPLLGSLLLQDYPHLEFIFVDDRSIDGTAALIDRFALSLQNTNNPQWNLRRIVLNENPGPNFKQYALGQGIGVAEGEYILLTDGDCEVPVGWARGMAARMQSPQVGAVLGPVFKRPGGRGFFYLYQAFDHAVRYMYLAASTGLGSAGGGFGNNLIVRKTTLDVIGGYASVPFSVTEDAALVARIRSHSHFKVRAACSYDVQVMTASETSWSDFIKQTLRWNNGGLFSPDLETRLNFGLLMVTISMGILALPLLPFFPGLWPLPLAVYIAMTMNTLATFKIAGPALPRFKSPWTQVWKYLVQLFFTPAYMTFLTILGLLGVKPTWKGKNLAVHD